MSHPAERIGKPLSIIMVFIVLATAVLTQGKRSDTTPRCQLDRVNIPASAKECARIKEARK